MLQDYGKEIDGIYYSFKCDDEVAKELMPLIDFICLLDSNMPEDGLLLSIGFVAFTLSKVYEKSYKVITWDYADNDILVVYTEDLTIPAKIMRGQKRVSNELDLPMTDYTFLDTVIYDKRIINAKNFYMAKTENTWVVYLDSSDDLHNDTGMLIDNMTSLMAAEMYYIRPEIMDYLLLPENYEVVFRDCKANFIYDRKNNKFYDIYRDGRIEESDWGKDNGTASDLLRRYKWNNVQFRDYGRTAPIC